MQTTLLNVILASMVLLAGLSLYVQSMTTEWEQRDYFARFKGHWWEGIVLSCLISLGVLGVLIAELGEEFWQVEYGQILALDMGQDIVVPNIIFIVLPLLVVVYVLAFSAWTDLLSGHAPSELAWIGIWLSMPFMAGYLATNDKPMIWVSLLIIGFVAFFLYFNRGLGDADVRLLWLINIGTVWWVGIYWTVMLFAAASFLQIAVHAVAQKAGWGRLLEVKYSKLEKSFRRMFSKIFTSIDPEKESRMRRHVPFIPVMAFTWIIGLTVLLVGFPELLTINNYWSFV